MSVFLYPCFEEERDCFSSVRPSVRNNSFRGTFLSNHASHSLKTWYGASARDPTHRLPNSGPPVIYFLFPGSVHFWTLHLGIAGYTQSVKIHRFLVLFVCVSLKSDRRRKFAKKKDRARRNTYVTVFAQLHISLYSLIIYRWVSATLS